MDTSASAAPAWIWLIVLGAVISYVYYGITVSRIFRKAGLKGWPAWVPVFNTWRIFQLGGQHGAWVFIALVPFVGQVIALVILIIAGVNIQSALQKPWYFYLLALLVTPVWYGILAWDRSTWQPTHTVKVPPSGYEVAPG